MMMMMMMFKLWFRWAWFIANYVLHLEMASNSERRSLRALPWQKKTKQHSDGEVILKNDYLTLEVLTSDRCLAGRLDVGRHQSDESSHLPRQQNSKQLTKSVFKALNEWHWIAGMHWWGTDPSSRHAYFSILFLIAWNHRWLLHLEVCFPGSVAVSFAHYPTLMLAMIPPMRFREHKKELDRRTHTVRWLGCFVDIGDAQNAGMVDTID